MCMHMTHVNTCMYAYTHTCTHIHTCTRHTHTHTHTRTHINTCTHTSHAHKHTHVHAHTHTHTHLPHVRKTLGYIPQPHGRCQVMVKYSSSLPLIILLFSPIIRVCHTLPKQLVRPAVRLEQNMMIYCHIIR